MSEVHICHPSLPYPRTLVRRNSYQNDTTTSPQQHIATTSRPVGSLTRRGRCPISITIKASTLRTYKSNTLCAEAQPTASRREPIIQRKAIQTSSEAPLRASRRRCTRAHFPTTVEPARARARVAGQIIRELSASVWYSQS